MSRHWHYGFKFRNYENDIKLLCDDVLIQQLVYLLYIPINSPTILPDQMMVNNAIEYRKSELLCRITIFPIKDVIVKIKQKIFIGKIKLSELEIQKTLNIAKNYSEKITYFYDNLKIM